jgi:hypothetical protein
VARFRNGLQKQSLFLSRLAIGVASIAFGFAGGFILDNSSDPVFRDLLARFDLGAERSIGCRLLFRCLRENTLLLFELYPFALRTPFFPGRGYCQTLFLPREPSGLRGFSRRVTSLKESSFRFGSGAAAIGEVIFSDVFQICVPIEVSFACNSGLYDSLREARGGRPCTIFQFFCLASHL